MKHKIILVACLIALLGFYVFQKNILGVFNTLPLSGFKIFLIKKSIRFLVNDFLMIGVIYGLFNNKEFVKIAFLVQLFGLIFLLSPYLLIKAYIGSYNGPLISFLHRLVLNPLLMILLIPAFYYQKHIAKTHE